LGGVIAPRRGVKGYKPPSSPDLGDLSVEAPSVGAELGNWGLELTHGGGGGGN